MSFDSFLAGVVSDCVNARFTVRCSGGCGRAVPEEVRECRECYEAREFREWANDQGSIDA